MQFLIRTIARAGTLFDNPFHARSSYIVPSERDVMSDFGRIAGDMRAVGKSLAKVIRKEMRQHEQ